MRSKGIKKIINGLTLGFALVFGMLLVGTSTTNAQDRDRDYRNNGQYNRDYDRDNDGDTDRYNNRDRINNQYVRAAFQRGYQDGIRQARQRSSNRGYGNNGGYYGNSDSYGNNGGYDRNRSGNWQMQQAYQQGFNRGYQEGINRYRNSRSRSVFGLPY